MAALPAEARELLASPDRRELLAVDPRTIPVRFSALKHIDKSPAHYLDACQHSKDETLVMRLGTGTHAMTFGRPEVVVYRGGMFQGPKDKKPKKYSDTRSGSMWKDFQSQHRGKVILNDREHEIATAMSTAILTSVDADPLLFAPGSQHEVEIRWKMRGRDCKGTLDALTPTAVPDLKATKDANPKWFPSTAVRNGWHAQTVWYADGAQAAGLGWRHPHLIAVENEAPYAVTVWRLTDEAIEHGRRTYLRWFARLLECERRNEWPGYSHGVIDFNVPRYMAGSADDGTDNLNESADD